jgi:hypothetical protein
VNGILDSVIRRFLWIVIALITAGAPVVADVCQLTCADTASPDMLKGGDGHAACHHAAEPAGPHVGRMPHVCDDSDGLTTPPPPPATNVHTRLAPALGVSGTIYDPLGPAAASLAPPDSKPLRTLDLGLVLPLRI